MAPEPLFIFRQYWVQNNQVGTRSSGERLKALGDRGKTTRTGVHSGLWLRSTYEIEKSPHQVAIPQESLRKRRCQLKPNFGALALKVGSTRIGNLPPEILGLIFTLVHQDLKTQKGELFEGMRALSTTCKDWHQLVSSISELWSFIHIVVNFDQEEMHMTTHSHLSAITTFLKLSRDVPLSLTLEKYGSPRRPETSISNHISKHTTAAFHLLSNDFHRWRSITCITNPPEVPSIPEGSVAPYLEHIDIKFHSDELQEAAYCQALVAAAPNLRSYVDNRSRQSIYGVPDQMPWAQLHKFHFSSLITAEEGLLLLDRAKSLVQFRFMMLESKNFFLAKPPLSRTTTMIRSMTIFSEHPREIQELLSRLDTPNLYSLDLHFIAFDFTRFFVSNLPQYCSISILPFLSSVASASFRLSSLGLYNLIVGESEFIDCLRILSPSLTDLTIQTNGVISPLKVVTNNVLKSLTLNGLTRSDWPLCPLLKNLTLQRCVGADDGVLSDMVQSRLSSQTAVNMPESHGTAVALTMLRRLDVVFTVHTHHVDEKRLNEFYEKGLVRGAVQFAPTQVGYFHASKLYNNSGGFQ
ncbi:uncharacterized protein LACBIDRAFT_294663 [Laccaria bicolor S238N-H82]|uniref:Predicted protein n=1 Tax=Laccaria bicolor (strain S238N-H82 / ATCC MYA-4686) TaxID=486041 RepID=B0DG47_LACBS|nr:uncharacterized protein LACBIDRAFT_294663 [Laccaria bicolor S238N-H82]EDR06449.1 predicted protein [Laccaria bicolor S238N-H82]|eukprot:XP_001882821.1 predicted protein [Laccaria bicolor S238N-H82]